MFARWRAFGRDVAQQELGLPEYPRVPVGEEVPDVQVLGLLDRGDPGEGVRRVRLVPELRRHDAEPARDAVGAVGDRVEERRQLADVRHRHGVGARVALVRREVLRVRVVRPRGGANRLPAGEVLAPSRRGRAARERGAATS